MADVLNSIVDALSSVVSTLGEQLNGVINTSASFFDDTVDGDDANGAQ